MKESINLDRMANLKKYGFNAQLFSYNGFNAQLCDFTYYNYKVFVVNTRINNDITMLLF